MILHFKINNYNTTTLIYPNFDFNKFSDFIKKISAINEMNKFKTSLNDIMKFVDSSK